MTFQFKITLIDLIVLCCVAGLYCSWRLGWIWIVVPLLHRDAHWWRRQSLDLGRKFTLRLLRSNRSFSCKQIFVNRYKIKQKSKWFPNLIISRFSLQVFKICGQLMNIIETNLDSFSNYYVVINVHLLETL